jgi:hypothetical protein
MSSPFRVRGQNLGVPVIRVLCTTCTASHNFDIVDHSDRLGLAALDEIFAGLDRAHLSEQRAFVTIRSKYFSFSHVNAMTAISPVYLTAEHARRHVCDSIGRDDEQMARLTMVLRGQASTTRVLNMM